MFFYAHGAKPATNVIAISKFERMDADFAGASVAGNRLDGIAPHAEKIRILKRCLIAEKSEK